MATQVRWSEDYKKACREQAMKPIPSEDSNEHACQCKATKPGKYITPAVAEYLAGVSGGNRCSVV